jgi:hypothetical protein
MPRWPVLSYVRKNRLLCCILAALTVSSLLAQAPAQQVTPASKGDPAELREELFKLLRMTPKLGMTVASDPSLLGETEYIRRGNPELAQFLQAHPEIPRNPDFYLFADLENGRRGYREHSRAMWFRGEFTDNRNITREIVPTLAFGCLFAGLLWVLRIILENRRWGRTFKVQTEIYNKLLDKFTSNEELLNYVRTGAGKSFLESVSIPIDSRTQSSAAFSRVLTPLQIGVVVLMVGAGFLSLNRTFQDEPSLAILGTLGVVLGIGFIVSAGMGWLLARHFQLLPRNGSGQPESGHGL